MAKDDLSSFRIGDLRRAEVRVSAGGSSKAAETEPPASVGFPSIEALLELDSIEEVADRLRPTYDALVALSSAREMKTRAAATKAMAAYERCADLLEYLFQTKAALRAPDADP